MRPRVWTCLSLAVLLLGCGQSFASQPPCRAEVQTVSIPGTRIAWYERGQGTPLLMLAGTGSTMSEWDPALLRLLARRHRLILFDYPGVGMSGPHPGRVSHLILAATNPGGNRTVLG